MDAIVRTALPGDADAIVGVLATVASEGWIATEPGFDLDARRDAFREMAEGRSDDRLWVLEGRDGSIVGITGLHGTGTAGVLALGMSLLPEARGGGRGREMLETAIAWAREEPSVHKLALDVWPENARAIALYASSGFEVEGLFREHYKRADGSLKSALVMGLVLRDANPPTARPGGFR